MTDTIITCWHFRFCWFIKAIIIGGGRIEHILFFAFIIPYFLVQKLINYIKKKYDNNNIMIKIKNIIKGK